MPCFVGLITGISLQRPPTRLSKYKRWRSRQIQAIRNLKPKQRLSIIVEEISRGQHDKLQVSSHIFSSSFVLFEMKKKFLVFQKHFCPLSNLNVTSLSKTNFQLSRWYFETKLLSRRIFLAFQRKKYVTFKISDFFSIVR